MAGTNGAAGHVALHDMTLLRTEISRMREAVGQLAADVAAIKAVTDAVQASHDATHGALWGKHDSLDTRLRKVETDYARQSELVAVMTRVNEVEKSQARMIGWGMAGMFLVQVIGLGGIAAIMQWAGK